VTCEKNLSRYFTLVCGLTVHIKQYKEASCVKVA
jgi:hypothetical protein